MTAVQYQAMVRIEKAKDLLKQAGYANGIEFTITVPANERLMYSENFKVESYATRNGDNTPIFEKEFRVTDEAHPVTIRTIGDRVRVEVDEVGTLGVETTKNVASDEITYQWYQYTHNAEDEDPKIDYKLNFTFNQAQSRDIHYAMSNNFGFGGQNACLLFKKL